jgi:hypothetical protein
MDVEEILSKEGGVDTTKVIDPIFNVPIAKRMGCNGPSVTTRKVKHKR